MGVASSLAPLGAALAAASGRKKIFAEVRVGSHPQQDAVAAWQASPAAEVIVCLPRCMAALQQRLVAELSAAGASVRTLAPLAEQLEAAAAPAGSGAMDVSALVGRVPRPLDATLLAGLLTGRRVLVTGAGGSIGSEICRVVAGFGPEALLAVERSENALFEMGGELRRRWPGVAAEPILHDITQAERTRALFARLRPDVVVHAAAHKHVGMMEGHPAEAIENNLYGTRSVAEAADAAGADRFVMISTDKAVNPSSVMGASKRLAERAVMQHAGGTSMRMCCVRFGNVLGSACSVLPIWEAQLARGGPLEVTDPRMMRYFMTIPEAAGLVLTAAALCGASETADAPKPQDSLSSARHDGGRGEVFLLDMGEPVRILDLAARFLRQRGLEPGDDVGIRITGARPGEKLFEELAHGVDEVIPTVHPGILAWRMAKVPARAALATRQLDGLRRRAGLSAPAWLGVGPAEAAAALRAAVPEMLGDHAATSGETRADARGGPSKPPRAPASPSSPPGRRVATLRRPEAFPLAS